MGSWRRARGHLGRFRCCWTLTFVAGIGSASAARGDTGRDWLEHYDVAASCPNESVFRRLVRERIADGDDALERLRVRLDIVRQPSSGSLLGTLALLGAAGGVTGREVADASCPALLEALSLVVALSADELALTMGGAEAQSARGESTDGWGDAPDPFAPESVDPGPSQPHADLALGPLVIASLQSALAPDALLGVGLGAAFEAEAPGVWSPRLEIAWVRFDGGDAMLADGRLVARFEAWVANATYCPLRLGSGDPWSLRPCFDIDAGRLTVSGTGPAAIRGQRRHAPWASGGLSVRAAVAPFRGPLQLACTLGGFLPLFRHEFYFAPNIEAFDAPPLGFRASARAAVAF